MESSQPHANGAAAHTNGIQSKPLKTEVQRKPNCLQRAGSFLAGGLELFYYKYVEHY